MSIVPDPKRPERFLVRYDMRHPITRKVVGLKRENIATKREAERIEKDLIIRVSEKVKRTITPNWSDCLKQYLTSLHTNGITNKTIYMRTKILEAHTLMAWGKKSIDSFNPNDLRLFFESEFKNNAITHTQFIYNCVNGVFKFAVECRYIANSPMPKMPFKKVDRIRNVLKEDHMKALLVGAQKLGWEWYPHYATALYTGMRTGELYALKWENVDIEARLLKVKVSWTKQDSFKCTKGNADRILEIPKPLVPTLIDLKQNANGREFVLPRIREWDHGEQSRHLKPILKTLDLPDITFHDLRASWATLLLSKNTPPIQVMFMGGWRTMKTMMSYLRKAGIDIRNSTDCLNDLSTHIPTQDGRQIW